MQAFSFLASGAVEEAHAQLPTNAAWVSAGPLSRDDPGAQLDPALAHLPPIPTPDARRAVAAEASGLGRGNTGGPPRCLHRRHRHQRSARGGPAPESGVYLIENGQRLVCAVHAWSNEQVNGAMRIDQTKYDSIRAWIEADTAHEAVN
jgi:hypothetical protein